MPRRSGSAQGQACHQAGPQIRSAGWLVELIMQVQKCPCGEKKIEIESPKLKAEGKSLGQGNMQNEEHLKQGPAAPVSRLQAHQGGRPSSSPVHTQPGCNTATKGVGCSSCIAGNAAQTGFKGESKMHSVQKEAERAACTHTHKMNAPQSLLGPGDNGFTWADRKVAGLWM